MTISKEIRKKKNDLVKESTILQKERFNDKLSKDKSKKIGEKQNEVYEKFKFYNSFIKTIENMK